MKKEAGYVEVEHTGDRAIRVWAQDVEGLLYQAAMGMYALMDITPSCQHEIVRALQVHFTDRENLLVTFLSDLLALLESEWFVLSSWTVRFTAPYADLSLQGCRVDAPRVTIKAVTYHDLMIHETEFGLEAVVVFDV